MKKITLLFLLISAFANAQNEIMLHIAPRLGNQVFALNEAVNHPGGTYQMKFTRFEYYVSEIKITHDGGQVTPCTGLYLLVRPATDSLFSLGQMPGIQNVEAITFSVGVDPTTNHLDPASYPAGNPLAPQNPSMHWGWSAGYRFAAIEGEAGTNLAQHFEIHALGDTNYKTQTISADAEQITPDMKMIHLVADYSQVVQNVNLSNGMIVHGTTGAAVTVLNNFNAVVFSAESSSATSAPSFKGTFNVSPNPASQNLASKISFSLPEGNNYELTVTNLQGEIITRQSLAAGANQTIYLDVQPPAGLYLVCLWQNASPVVLEKLIVLN